MDGQAENGRVAGRGRAPRPWERTRIFGAALLRYGWIFGFGAVTLSLAVLSLAAYQFQENLQSRLGSADAKFIDYQIHLGNLLDRKEIAERLSDERRRTYEKLLAEIGARLDDGQMERLVDELRREQIVKGMIVPLPDGSPPLLSRLEGMIPLGRVESSAFALLTGGREGAGPPAGAADRPEARAVPGPETAVPPAAPIDIDPIVKIYGNYLENLRYRELIADEYISLHQAVQPEEYRDFLRTVYRDLLQFDNLRFVTFWLFDPAKLALMPNWILSLIVVLCMGGLGSLLYVMKSFLQDKLDESAGIARMYRPLSWFFMRPLMGVVTALAIFVFLQAGLALTDGALAVGSSGVNPFFGAFIALVSGLMSWQALERIEHWGGRFFGTEAKHRWAYGLEGAFSIKPEKTKDMLADHLGVSIRQIESWAREQQPVPHAIQERIAAWFEIDHRHLFSDQATSPAPAQAVSPAPRKGG